MLVTDEEREICKKYSKRSKGGYVNCDKCPLVRISQVADCTCKANSHYDEAEKTWIPDYWTEKE